MCNIFPLWRWCSGWSWIRAKTYYIGSFRFYFKQVTHLNRNHPPLSVRLKLTNEKQKNYRAPWNWLPLNSSYPRKSLFGWFPLISITNTYVFSNVSYTFSACRCTLCVFICRTFCCFICIQLLEMGMAAWFVGVWRTWSIFFRRQFIKP